MTNTTPQIIRTTCCIVGGGPAGMMLGLLLARQGVDVVVLEKHEDFFRDFRGDTIHPSTLELMHELGVLEEFLRKPHQSMQIMSVMVGRKQFTLANFKKLPVRCKYIAFMPQWDFLSFLREVASRFERFSIRMETEATGLIEENGRVVGVRAHSPAGELNVVADLVIGTDGRHSTIRSCAGFAVTDYGVPIDVLWLKLPKDPAITERSLGYFNAGKMMVLIDRGDYFQTGYIIQKGEIENLKRRGIESFRTDMVGLAPFLKDSVGAITDWAQVKLLTVKIDRLPRWHRPGVLCIGDAAHAMSPAGGVGINLAIQDAVAAANILGPKLRAGAVTDSDLHAVQRRRERPTKIYQRVQQYIHDRFIPHTLARQAVGSAPTVFYLFKYLPFLRRFPARIIGVGICPEHVRGPVLLEPE